MAAPGGGIGNPALARGPLGRRVFGATRLSSVNPSAAIVSTGIEWDVFQMLPGAASPTYFATLYEASRKSIRVQLNGTGTGSFAINRSSPECTESILAQGNLVKVRIPEIGPSYLFGFFLETGDFSLISSQEAGGEMLTFGGRGILSYLEYACAWSESFIAGGQDPAEGVWRAYAAGTGAKPGQILRRMLEEMQHADRPQKPLPHLTVDFDYSADSAGSTWITTNATAEFAYQVGETGLAIVERLMPTGIILQMGPGFDLHAYNAFGRNLAGAAFGPGVVRFARGQNIATELRRARAAREASTHMLVGGETDHYARAVWPAAAELPTREAFVASFGVTATALVGVGSAELSKRHAVSDTITFPIANRRTALSLADPITVGDTVGPGASVGAYLPGPAGTNGNFWLGDRVRVHTGSGPFDYNEVDAIVDAITIGRDDDNAELIVIPELVTVPPLPVLCDSPYADTPEGYYPPLGGPVGAADGQTFYGRAGVAMPEVPTPNHNGAWHFPEFQTARGDAENPAGWVDGNLGEATNMVRIPVVHRLSGHATIYLKPRAGKADMRMMWKLKHRDAGLAIVDNEGHQIIPGDVSGEVSIPLPANPLVCVQWIDITKEVDFSVPAGTAAASWDGWRWTLDP